MAPGLGVAVRLSLFDLIPFVPGPDGTGEPELSGEYPYAFGGDGTGRGIDLRETHALIDALRMMGRRSVVRDGGKPVLRAARPAPRLLPSVRRLPAS